ncbi:MAG: glycosyltransferase [Chloroflexota bacterium]
MSDDLPAEVQALLRERASARAQRDWTTADALREQLRELGWEAVDAPRGSTARPLLTSAQRGAGYADDLTLDSVLNEPASVAASLVTVADDHPDDMVRLVDGVRLHTQMIDHELLMVANAPAGGAGSLPQPGQGETMLEVRQRLGWADAVNLGLRRARGRIVVLLDTSIEPTGDFLSPLLSSFDDAKVGLAGPWGVTSADGRQFSDAPPGDVDAIEGYCLAIRREALQQVGGFDHHFRFYRNADLDLSFAVRANGWRALRTDSLPLRQHEHRAWTAHDEPERDRLSRRNFYRFLKHWGDRRDLLLHSAPRPGPAGRG